MTVPPFTSPDEIRARFSRAMSRMYREEVPAYGALMDIVAEVNAAAVTAEPGLRNGLVETDSLDRITEERHGAIRLGTAAELSMMRRLFAIMGMFPVGYYDLSVAGIPVHSTAFRPLTEASLKRNPFRVFTSLLRLNLIEDPALRDEAEGALARRDIFTPGARALVLQAKRDGGLTEADAERFVGEALETFRWHDRALVSSELYERLHGAHRLLADVVSFKGPHINHLTPRTLDIDRVQALMPARGITPKETIEGPPRRRCPILLRQTSFKALEEAIAFEVADGSWQSGKHTARFGEIEQRGAALTRKGRALYDQLLASVQEGQRGVKDPADREQILLKTFAAFPDSPAEMRRQGLAYFEYVLTDAGRRAALGGHGSGQLEALVKAGLVAFHPIVYEDFLPVSAAGIFQSNLGEGQTKTFARASQRQAFEAALGAPVADEFALYEAMEQDSIRRCLAAIHSADAA